MVRIVSRFARIKNAFTAAGRTQNKLMNAPELLYEKGGFFGNLEKARVPLKFYSKKLSDGSTMLKGYYGGSRTSDITYLIGRDGAYMNIKRAALDPAKKTGLISGQTRTVEHYNQQGLLKDVEIKSKTRIAGLPAKDVRFDIYETTPYRKGESPTTRMYLKADDMWVDGSMSNNGNVDYKAEILGQQKGGKFNIFEQLGKLMGLG